MSDISTDPTEYVWRSASKDIVRVAALTAAGQFHALNHTALTMEPGDGTRYDIMIVTTARPRFSNFMPENDIVGRPDEAFMATNFGGLYPFSTSVRSWHYDYVASKWGGNNNWSGVVLAYFLEEFTARLAELAEGDDRSFQCDWCGRVGTVDDGIDPEDLFCPDEECGGPLKVIS